MKKNKAKRRVLLVTGLSGAGLSTALKALEDIGYKAVDNLPLALVDDLLRLKAGRGKPVAIGVDSRTWDFSAARLLKKADALRRQKGVDPSLIFINCEDDALQRRFTETRRVHPLATDRPVRDGVALERQMMQPVRKGADRVIDTTDLKAHDLRRLVEGAFALAQDRGLFVSVISFAFRNGIPREADLVFDVRFLHNPYYSPRLRQLSGQDAAVGHKIKADPGYRGFFRGLTGLLAPLLPRYDREGKNYLTVAVGCTGGRHRSVFVAEELCRWLSGQGAGAVAVRHRDLEKWEAQQYARRHENSKRDTSRKEKAA